MQVTVKKLAIPSSDGVHTLRGVIYIPDGEIKGLFQIVHGMTEYIGRYDAFMRFLSERGYVTFGCDHIGHGTTADSDADLGYFAEKDGWKVLVRDVGVVSKAVRADYPGKKYILLGHSMGSFISRLYVALGEDRPDMFIISGTGGKNSAAGVGVILSGLICLFKGKKHYSPLLYKLSFGTYNERTEKRTEKDWLSYNTENVDKYIKDKYCMFHFSASAMSDLIMMTKLCGEKQWFDSIPKALPMLIISGEEDPVGAYGKGTAEVADRLAAAGCENVTLHLFKGMRHEILNETEKEKVMEYIFDWIK